MRRRSWISLGLLATVAVLAGAALGGCSTLAYYGQSVGGHLALMSAARPVPEWVADEATPAELKRKLELTQRIRDFAVAELKLPDNGSYRRYADLHRPAAVWNVVAAPPLSLTLKTWCFPVVGCIGYRGYYDRADADKEAEQLRAAGLEVNVYPVPAYSTLGWMNWAGGDPLLSTFIRYPEGELARLIFHELAHQVAYASGDTMFNESFATSVERLGGERWLATHGSAGAREEYARFDQRRREFRAFVRGYRDELAAIYRSADDDTAKRERKAAVMQRLQADYERMKTERWDGYTGYDGWFQRANNAAFGVLAAYTELVPQFDRLFEHEGRDFARFYAEVRRLAKLPKEERRAALAGG